MSSKCGACEKSVSRSDREKIICVQCKIYFHGTCVGLGESELDVLFGKEWLCTKCGTDRRRSRGLSDSIVFDGGASSKDNCDGSVSVNVLKDLINEAKNELLSKLIESEKELGISMNAFHEKLDEKVALLTKQQEIIDRQQGIIDQLTADNCSLKRKLGETLIRLDDLEQYSRRNTLEIRGVPVSQGEDVVQRVVDVGTALGVRVDPSAVDACHRLSSSSGREAPAIIVKFTKRAEADKLLDGRRKKKDLTARHMGLPAENRIFVNLSLCASRRVLLARARVLQRELGWKYVWVDRPGRVKVRRKEGDKFFIINSETDLLALKNK
jgi:hypothetical protein